ncbi:mechanosensitive ion channel domain-containing protein, partial [Prosthecobacter sp.]|uniref:mechanosensitive ion channel family protein n=1 Tax=Prosthecobacter sp. TaxID=1965333 RepID=UPI0024873812
GAQFTQLWLFAQRQWMQFVWLGLIFGTFVMVLSWVRRGAAKWTDEDPSLKRASLVLHLPVAMAGILSLLVCSQLFEQSPRLFWAILSTLALVPINVILRALIQRSLFPVLNALCVFVLIAEIRKVAATVPELSRLLLLLEMIGAALFLAWFIRSTRSELAAATSHKVARAAARLGLLLFAGIFFANVFGYVRMANYLAAGTLSASYSAILLYAAAVSLAGLIFFALRVRPLSELRLVSHHRALIHRRCTSLLFFLAAVIWALVALGEFSLRVPLLEHATAFLNAEIGYRSLQFSLGAVLAFALTLWIAVLLSRFIRFVLEEDVYRRLHLASGPAYAASSLLHYIILLVGFFAAMAALGMDMTRFAVLGGALGLGLGFGLQNIVNNFVSGLILLFERPVNVGDVVQVGETTGVIQRIGIRASVIRIANSSELIVPNSMLISEKVTNWTLSNRQRRIELQVGVAYGSDPRRVIDLLTSVAVAHPLAAKIPTPQTLMTAFGTDSLNFEMRLWTNDYDNWMQIKSDVAVAVNEALAAAAIAIPFPQRDLHLQSIDPAVLELLKNTPSMKPALPDAEKPKTNELV